MPFIRFYYHLVWATKHREPTITESEAAAVLRSFELTVGDVDAIPFASAVLADHAHIALAIPPSLAVSVVIQRLKGASSHAVNDARGHQGSTFAWQADYGALTFGEGSLDRIVAYIQNQRAHHAAQTLWPLLEQSDDGYRTHGARLPNSTDRTP